MTKKDAERVASLLSKHSTFYTRLLLKMLEDLPLRQGDAVTPITEEFNAIRGQKYLMMALRKRIEATS